MMLKSFFENVRKPQSSIGGRIMLKGMNRNHEQMAAWGRALLAVEPGDHVLDLGCGGGRNVQAFLEAVQDDGRVYGMDYSPASVAMTQRLNRAAVEAGRCAVVTGDVTTLPFEDGTMDKVSAFETVYFWPDLAASFAEVYRVLKSGGRFLICNESADPEAPDIRKWSDMLAFPVYTAEDLIARLSVAGFTAGAHRHPKGYAAVVATRP